MIHFTCPCGKPLHARDEYVGEMTRCPGCNRELVIPGEQGVQAEAPPPRDQPNEEVRRRRPGRPRYSDWEDRPRPPATSGMAVASMILGVMSLFCSVILGIPALILGGLSWRAIGRSEGRLQGKGLAAAGLVTGGLSLLLLPAVIYLGVIPFYTGFTEGFTKRQSANNLKQIGLAMMNYSDTMNGLPPAAICDRDGKPLLSWRVAILPYIEEGNLYQQFHLNEPWDSPNNIQLVSRMPKIYALPGDATTQPGHTPYRVFVGEHAVFDVPRPRVEPAPFGPPLGPEAGAPDEPLVPQYGRRMTDIMDGTSNTILVAEAATAAPWTKPDELPFDPAAPLPPLGGHFTGGFQVLMADGEVHWVSKDVSPTTLRAAITRDGGEILGPDW